MRLTTLRSSPGRVRVLQARPNVPERFKITCVYPIGVWYGGIIAKYAAYSAEEFKKCRRDSVDGMQCPVGMRVGSFDPTPVCSRSPQRAPLGFEGTAADGLSLLTRRGIAPRRESTFRTAPSCLNSGELIVSRSRIVKGAPGMCRSKQSVTSCLASSVMQNWTFGGYRLTCE